MNLTPDRNINNNNLIYIYAKFSVDGKVFYFSTESYFLIYSLPSKRTIVERTFGGLRCLANVGDSPLHLIVPSGDKAGIESSPRRPKFWNAEDCRVMHDFVFDTAVENCAWNRELIIFLTANKIHIYDLGSLQTRQVLDRNTQSDAMVLQLEGDILCYPSTEKGSIVIYQCKENRPLSCIQAHRGDIAVMAISRQGDKLATVSTTGTILRIFAVPTGELLLSFRISTLPLSILFMSFCPLGNYVICYAKSGYVYLFSLVPDRKEDVIAMVNNEEDDYCTVVTRSSTSGGEGRVDKGWMGVLTEAWQSPRAQQVLDTGLHSLSQLSSFFSASPPSKAAGSLGHLQGNEKLLRPCLEDDIGQFVQALCLATSPLQRTPSATSSAAVDCNGLAISKLSSIDGSVEPPDLCEFSSSFVLLISFVGVVRCYDVVLPSDEAKARLVLREEIAVPFP